MVTELEPSHPPIRIRKMYCRDKTQTIVMAMHMLSPDISSANLDYALYRQSIWSLPVSMSLILLMGPAFNILIITMHTPGASALSQHVVTLHSKHMITTLPPFFVRVHSEDLRCTEDR